MRVPRVEIETGESHLLNKKIITDLNIIPHPCAIYILKSQEIHMNAYTFDLLGLKGEQNFDINKFLTINPHLQSLLYKKDFSNITFLHKVKIKLFNGKYDSINLRAQLIPDQEIGKVYFISLSRAEASSSVNPMFSLYLVKNEIDQLKPYLSETGMAKLDKIIKAYFSEKSKTLILEDLIVYEKELQVIQKKLPELSSREVLLCVLLLNNLSLNEIATLTNRTLNSVSVNIHRINKKLNLLNKNELITKLQEIANLNPED